MGGKAALVLMIGFIIIFSFYQSKLSHMTVAAAENYNVNYIETLVHESAMTAANFGVNKVWDLEVTSDSMFFVTNACSSMVLVDSVGLDTVKVFAKAWGYVFEEGYYAQYFQPRKVEDSLFAYFAYNTPLSRYFWFTNSEKNSAGSNVYWVSGDTVWGPAHTNGTILTYGSPVFYGKVTAHMGFSPDPSTSPAKYYGGWEVGIEATIPTNMTQLVNAAYSLNGGAPINTKCIYDTTISLNFLPDGNVIRTLGTNPPNLTDTIAVSYIAPAGVLYCTESVRVKGTYNCALTIYANSNIWVDNDLVAADDPLNNPNSDDIMGLVSDADVILTDNAANNSDLVLQACSMAINGSFRAENYSTRPVAGGLYLTGIIVQNYRGAVGTGYFSGGNVTITHGFSKRYRFDPRLYNITPPYYPFVRVLRLVAWWE